MPENPPPPVEPPEPPKAAKWKNSVAKKHLRADILSGAVPPGMKAKEVYAMRPQYKQYPYKNFRSNLLSLRKLIAKDKERMRADCEAYGHDRALLAQLRADDPPENIPWHRSEAKKLLEKDIDDGKHLQMKPSEMYDTREEYQAFSLKVFRNHIYQEVDSQAKREYKRRFSKKKMRKRIQAAVADSCE